VDVNVNNFDTTLLFPRGSVVASLSQYSVLDSGLIGLGSIPVQEHHVMCSWARPFTLKLLCLLRGIKLMGTGDFNAEGNPAMD